MTNYARSRVYDLANAPAPVGEEARRRNTDLKKEGWHKFGLLVIDPEDVPSDFDRQILINIANKQYGHRRGKA